MAPTPRPTSSPPGPSADRPATADAVGAEWADLLRLVPGYDPFAGAEEAGCWFDAWEARRALDFFPRMLVHVEGDLANRPFELQPWQRAIVANLFGWKRTDDAGRAVRRYRQLFLYVPRKCGKTPLVAGISLYVFFCDGEAGQQDYISAKSKEQAGLLFRQMQGMVERNPRLKAKCHIYGGNAPGGQSRSFVKDDNSFLKVISADGDGKHGGNSHLAVIDELHEQDSRELYDALRTSMTSVNRKQPLFVLLTTADYDRESICNERYAYAKKVQADPARDLTVLPVVYEAGPADPWDDERTWEKANPNLDVSVSRAELRNMVNEARDNPALQAEFRRLHTNVRVQRTITGAIDLVAWDAAAGRPVADDEVAGLVGYGGLDLGWRDDLAALSLFVPLSADEFALKVWFWCPEGTRRDLRASPWAEWVRAGLVQVTDGDTTDFAAIRERLDLVRDLVDLRTLTMDPSYARSEYTQLMGDGFPVVEFRQSHQNYTAPWKWLSADGIKGRKLRHGGHPVLRAQAGHVAIEVTGTDGVMPKKKKSTDKIDGVCAALMAISGYLVDPDRGGPASVYNTRGLASVHAEPEPEDPRPVAQAVGRAGDDPRQDPGGDDRYRRYFFGDD